VLVSFFFRVEISWTFRWKIALYRDVFVADFHVVQRAIAQHFLAVKTLIAVFLVDSSDVFLLVFIGEKIIGAESVEVALDRFRFVVQSNMWGQASDHLFAVDAEFNCCSTLVIFQNVFVPLFKGQKVGWTILMKVAFYFLFAVQILHMSAQVIDSFVAVNALFCPFVPLVKIYYVLLFFFFRLEIKSAPIVELALDDFTLMMGFYVII